MRSWVGGLVIFILAACNAPGRDQTAPVADETRAAIQPHQFAIIPCKPPAGDTQPRCKLLVAGGKYFLMGAPDGARDHLLEAELRLLDGVLLFDLLPDHLDGLDTLRIVTWQKGRAQPLLLIGPEGTSSFAAALDAAFETPDAEYFSRQSVPGGFDASILRPVEIPFGTNAGTQVVDTGDLIIRGFHAPSGQIVYQAQYQQQIAASGLCGGAEDEAFLAELAAQDRISACAEGSRVRYFIE